MASVPAAATTTTATFLVTTSVAATCTVSSDTTSFTVTVTVQATCALSANPLSFVTYADVLINATSTISATRNSGTTYNIGLNAGSATGATVTNRMMIGPSGALLHYSLFCNSSYSANWGNTTGSRVSGTGTGTAQTLTV
jgi:spore coat protein U-like protein